MSLHLTLEYVRLGSLRGALELRVAYGSVVEGRNLLMFDPCIESSRFSSLSIVDLLSLQIHLEFIFLSFPFFFPTWNLELFWVVDVLVSITFLVIYV